MRNPFKRSGGPPVKQLIERGLAAASRKVEKADFDDEVVEVARQKEGLRIKTLGSFYHDKLIDTADSFPKAHKVPAIYHELADALFGMENIEKSKSALKKAAKRVKDFQMIYLRKMKRARHTQNMRILRKEFYGRVVGTVKQNKKHVTLLFEAGKTLKRLPNFEEIPTLIIAGLPNVGKTSLLKCITGSDPKIALYPFTTQGLMLGYTEMNFKKIQLIDTPGLLDRPLSKRNKAERQGIAALKHLADAIIYVYDISETCGYTIEQQKKLFKDMKKLFKKPMIIVANKIDTIGGHPPEEVDGLPVSCETKEGIPELKNLIKSEIKIK